MSRKRYTQNRLSACCAKPRWPWRRASPLVKLVARSAYRSRVTIAESDPISLDTELA